MTTTLPFCLPKTISAEQFVTEYWQKKPLLIKNGLATLANMFEPEDILALAQDDAATARLITQHESQWHLQQSPLQAKHFSKLPDYWTVLIQNMEQWSPELASLWHAFDYIPQWQRDDIMVSYAPTGGSVGRHYDNYDVFLAQGYGHRRWQLGAYCDEKTEFEPHQPIRLLSEAQMGKVIFDEVLAPGDVLYVPANLSHYGVAQDDCLTFSFGFRRPSLLQLLDSLADVSTQHEPLSIPLKISQNLSTPGMVDDQAIEDIKRQLITLLQSQAGDTLLRQAVAEIISKRQYNLMLPEDYLDTDELQQALFASATIQQDLASRIIYLEVAGVRQVYINGVLMNDVDNPSLALLCRLADGEVLDYQALLVSNVNLSTINEWLENGWIWLDDA